MTEHDLSTLIDLGPTGALAILGYFARGWLAKFEAALHSNAKATEQLHADFQAHVRRDEETLAELTAALKRRATRGRGRKSSARK